MLPLFPHRITLWHEHARFFLEHEARLDAAFRGWKWEKVVAGIADEAYWGTVGARHGLRMWGYTLTYMEPGDPKSGHPALFGPADVQRVRQAAQQEESTPRFFARKFQTTAAVDQALVGAMRRAAGK